MKFNEAIAVSEIANFIAAKILGDAQQLALGINEIHRVEKGDITFVDHPKYYEKSLSSEASIIIIDQEVAVPEGKTLLIHAEPFKAYNSIALKHRPERNLEVQIDPSADIDSSAVIEPGAVIGQDVRIGKNTIIQSGVVIYEHCVIGDNCLIQSGTRIGTDAFYYKKENGNYNKWRSCGRVVIHDHVDIGANCTINRGVSSDTIIGKGTKLDCLIHIGHGTHIGESCLLAAQVGVAGKCNIGDNVTIYGQVGVAQNATIESGTIIYAQSGIPPGKLAKGTYYGSPADDAREQMKRLVALKKLPDFLRKKN
jgi:UDP-3-O-[3-hydroxymyristoyl] glucosamine N-acyltransferase